MLRFGIIGTGVIATQFIKEAKLNENIEIRGVVARNYAKTQLFAEMNHIPHTYENVEDMLGDESLDAIYIATLHPTHAYYSKLALLADKHVLCEKPAAIKPWQIEELIMLAKKQNKVFMEAMTIGFHPLYQKLKTNLKNGLIGEITHIETSYGKMSKKAHKHTPELAGGCIYDIGIYNLFFILDLLGKTTNIQGQDRNHRIWNVPGTVQMLGKHENGAQSYSFMTMDAISTSTATIIGTEGTITIPNGWVTPTVYKVIKSDGTIYEEKHEQQRWLGYEIDAFYNLVQSGNIESDIMTWQKSLDLQIMIEQLYEKLNLQIPNEAIIM